MLPSREKFLVMRKQGFFKTGRHPSLWSRAWMNLRFYWHTTHKAPLIFMFTAGLILIIVAYFMYSIFTRQNDMHDLTCLAFNVYFEARGESVAGQYAVAEVTMNRVASGRYGDSVCSVVHQKNWDPLRQRYVSGFSWNELDDRPSLEDKTYRQAWDVAEAVYYGRYTPQLAGALHYHAVYIKPSWARGQKPIAQIGQHLFYK